MISGSSVLPSGNSHGVNDSVGGRPLRLYEPTQICNGSVFENSLALSISLEMGIGDTAEQVEN